MKFYVKLFSSVYISQKTNVVQICLEKEFYYVAVNAKMKII